MKNFKPTKYVLENLATGRRFEDTGWLLSDPQGTEPSLIRAIYEKKQIDFGDQKEGIYRFADWLPINHTLKGSSATQTYKSEALASELGLPNLYISFSGYWPEKNAFMTTG